VKISYRTQGSGAYTLLADDTAGTYIFGFQPRMMGRSQVTPLFRSSKPFVAARGNRLWQLGGTVIKDNGTAAAAAAFIQSNAAAFPDFVDLKIEEGATAIYLTPAVLVEFSPAVNGAETVISYGFVGGDLTTTAP